jgi:hypothetical protein
MLWLLQCLDGGVVQRRIPVPQIMSIGQFLLSRLFSSLTSSVLRSGFILKRGYESYVNALIVILVFNSLCPIRDTNTDPNTFPTTCAFWINSGLPRIHEHITEISYCPE